MTTPKIPLNTIIHTPTATEAETLLSILASYGYRWRSRLSVSGENTRWSFFRANTAYAIREERKICIADIARPQTANRGKNESQRAAHDTVISFLEFKTKYCK